MLVLTRRINEWIKIGEDITIIVTEVNGGSIKLGIDAPQNVVILRGEVKERIDDGIEKQKNLRGL